VPRPDLLDRINGLGAASEIAGRLGESPWNVWRRYSVTSEGPLYVIRVRDPDPRRAAQLIEAVRDTLVADLRQRYDAAMEPHREYIAALERDVAALGHGTGGPSSVESERAVAGARIRKQLRDAQVFAGMSEMPDALAGVSRLDAPQNARRWRLTLTGAVVGFLASFVVLAILAWRLRSAAFAGA
jgi:hypothetical protein